MPNEHPQFNILVVEGNLFFRTALSDALQSHFLFPKLTRAESVQKALTKIDAVRPDMIFIDASLPDGNGLELTRRLRAAGNDAVISILASRDLPEYREEAARSGAEHFFVKGLTDISEIFAAVESTLAPRFRTLIVAEEPLYGALIRALVYRSRPGAVVACASNWDEALDIAAALQPQLVMLRSSADASRESVFCEQLHRRCAGGQTKVVIVGDTPSEGAPAHPAASGASGQEKADIISSLRSRLKGLSSLTWT